MTPLTATQITQLKSLLGPDTYAAYLALGFTEATDIPALLAVYNTNVYYTAAAMADALASKAAQVTQIDIGPIKIKLNPEMYIALAGRMRGLAKNYGLQGPVTSFRVTTRRSEC